MNEITILDLFLMLAHHQNNPQSAIDILKSMYEKTHNYYIAFFTAWLILVGGILGSFIALLSQEQITSGFITVIVIIAVISVLVAVITLIRKMNRLHRDYLDILQIYNLLSQYF